MDDSTVMLGDSGFSASAAAYLVPLPTGSSGSRIFRKRFDALLYIERLAYADMECRSIKPDRIQSSCQRIRASFYLAYGICLSEHRELWKRFPSGTIDESLPPSADQQEAIRFFVSAVSIADADQHFTSARRLFLVGEPGSGKTEVFIRFCAFAIKNQLRVLILCPTGQLVASYRQKLPEHEAICIDTIHAGLAIYREDESLVEHSPPSKLRLYDTILIDEGSQIDDDMARKLVYALECLPQKPFIGVAADYRQLQPVGKSGAMHRWCLGLHTITLRTIHRTKDMELLTFLGLCRTKQPSRMQLYDFFQGRRYRSGRLLHAVRAGMRLAEETGKAFMWLCVTNAGADHINRAMLHTLGLLEKAERLGVPGDPNSGDSMPFFASPGIAIRLTRNLDKERGFVNGAMGYVDTILHCEDERPIVFTVRLIGTGVLVLVHPIWTNKQRVLPCTYGYATTIRRAQGATYYHGCLYFDHSYPPEPGYGYVGASRFQSRSGCYLYGKIRRTDWVPVHPARESADYDLTRGEMSDDDYSSGEEDSHYQSYADYLEHGAENSGSDNSADYDRCRNSDDDELSDGCSSDGGNSMLSEDFAESRQRMEDYFESLVTASTRTIAEDDMSSLFGGSMP